VKPYPHNVLELIHGLRRIRERLHLFDGDFGVDVIDRAILMAEMVRDRDLAPRLVPKEAAMAQIKYISIDVAAEKGNDRE
jgi:uncharacterized protein with von Willebrand factor type A (vWA) domain